MICNRRVAQLIQAKRLTPDGKMIGLQRKLTVGAADDQYEQEADRVARQVLNTSDAVAAHSMQRPVSPEEDKDQMLQTKPLAASITPFVQRRLVHNEGSEDKERPVQAKFFSETSREPLQRQPDTEEDETAGALTESFEAGADVETQVSQSKGRGSPVPDAVRTYMEPRFGVDFSQVRVHTGSDAIHMNRDVGAQAFTHGSDIYFGEGHCPSNLELTAHELTHVVQQTGGAALTQGYRKYKATFQASPPFGASHHPASDHPAPRGATPQASPEHQLGSLAGSQQAAIRRPEYSSRLPDDGGRQVLVLQRAAGNVAAGQAVRALLREPLASEAPPENATGMPVPAVGPAADAAGLSDEDRRKLDYARTTLAKVKPLAKDDEAVLRKLLAGSPIHALIEQRNAVRDNLVRLVMTGEDEELKRSSEIGGKTYWDRLGELSTQLQQLEGGIGGALKAIGVADEGELKDLVSDRFPTLFLKRAEEIALTLLDQNAAVARAEAPRFGLMPDQVGAGPGAAATLNERMSITEPGGHTGAAKGMKLAAGELAGLQTLVDAAKQDVETARKEAIEARRAAPSPDDDDMDWRVDEGYADEGLVRAAASDPNVKQAEERQAQQAAAFEQRRNQLGLQYPVLFKVDDYRALALASDEEVQAVAGGKLAEILDNIDKTKQYIKDGDLKVWHLREVFDMTMQDLGIGPDSPLFAAVEKRVADEEHKDSIIKIAKAAIAITAAIITAIPSAGASLTAAASVTMFAISASSLHESVTAYNAETAASNVALDPAFADISVKSPDMKAVALDLVAFGLDAVQVASAIAKLSTVIRAARATGELGELAAAARAIPQLGEAGVERLVSNVARESEVASRIDHAVNAIGATVAPPAATAVERELARLGDEALQLAYRDLQVAGRIFPLTEDALRMKYGAQAAELIGDGRTLRASAFYDRETGWLFIRNTTLEGFTAAFLHEATHYLQNIYRPGMTQFMREFEAYSVQRSYLQRLVADGANPDVAFPNYKWLVDADNERIVQHIWDRYQVRPPPGADLEAAVMEALGNVGRIEVP